MGKKSKKRHKNGQSSAESSINISTDQETEDIQVLSSDSDVEIVTPDHSKSKKSPHSRGEKRKSTEDTLMRPANVYDFNAEANDRNKKPRKDLHENDDKGKDSVVVIEDNDETTRDKSMKGKLSDTRRSPQQHKREREGKRQYDRNYNQGHQDQRRFDSKVSSPHQDKFGRHRDERYREGRGPSHHQARTNDNNASTHTSDTVVQNTTFERDLSKRFFHTKHEDEVILVLSHNETFHFHGKFTMEVLIGSLKILGYQANGSRKEHLEVYSPESSNALALETEKSKCNREDQYDILRKSLGGDHISIIERIMEHVNRFSVIVRLKSLDNRMIQYITSITPFNQLFGKKMSEGHVKCTPMHIIDPWTAVGVCPLSEEDSLAKGLWFRKYHSDISEELLSSTGKYSAPVTAICGGKNVGKSTLGRYLVNSLLKKYPKVVYLECDVGQTEFTPPGCLALNMLSEPLLGPSFTHQRQPHKMVYFGALSPGDNPQHYLNCVQDLAHMLHALDGHPIIVNTMGWNKGLGVALMVDILNMVKPNHVVQIDSQRYSDNFPPLTPDFVSSTPGWRRNGKQDVWNSTARDALGFQLHRIQSESHHNKSRERYTAAVHRNFALLSYISQLQVDRQPLKSLNAMIPREISWGQVAVHVAHAMVPKSQMLYAFNASMVALCRVPEHKLVRSGDETLPKFVRGFPITECFGFGIMRAIDPVKKVFCILTPVSQENLIRVNCLVKGGVEIPHELLMNQTCVGRLSYVGVTKDVIGSSSLRQNRRRMKRKTYGAPAEKQKE